jgi:hypothetical protein
MARKVMAGVLTVLVLAVGGCKDTNPLTGNSPSTVVFPTTNVRYSLHVQPLFNQACAYAGCHDAGTTQSVLKLDNYTDAVLTIPGIVVPGKPDASTLVHRIQGSLGQRMPPTGNPLNQNQINGIRTWVADSAKNN